MTTIEYAICLEAEKIRRFDAHRPKGWQRLIEIAEEIEKRNADQSQSHGKKNGSAQKTNG